ncbi:MAG: type II CAAX endopeptidase family protein [Oscillospiraceae bacterium]|nr:type II CAAX endopeptidase family protein [Oscillospiraceae bacterium]MDD4368028.1 type II CAAX endopeptidase family protein [Oscillospiraceae bacterium]
MNDDWKQEPSAPSVNPGAQPPQAQGPLLPPPGTWYGLKNQAGSLQTGRGAGRTTAYEPGDQPVYPVRQVRAGSAAALAAGLKPAGKRHFTIAAVLIPLAFMLVHIVIQNICMVVATFILMARSGGSFSYEELMSHQTLIILFSSLISIAVYSAALTVMRRRQPAFVWFKRPTALAVGLGALAILGAVGSANLVMLLLSWLADYSSFWRQNMQYYEDLATAFTDQSGLLVQIVTLCILVPIAEEMLFRGIIAGQLKRAFSDPLAIILTALAFAAFHMNWVQSSYVLIPALVLSAAYIWSESLPLTIVMHGIFNFFGSVLPGLLQNHESAANVLSWIEVGIMPLSAVALFIMYRHYKARRQEPQTMS